MECENRIKVKIAAILLGGFVGFTAAATVNNPLIWADVPDVSMLRVENTYYMVSTTMHMAPGVPVMASEDLARWRTVGYAYRTLANSDQLNLENGKHAYGKGSWASSIRFRDGYFYVLTPSYTTGKTHLYKTKDLKSEKWDEVLLPFYHDPSLFFDDDGSAWIFYGNSPIKYVQLNDDAGGIKIGGKSGEVGGTEIEPVAGSSYIVKQEGAHMEKVNGEYYLYTISWPSGKCRTSVVYRSKNLLSGFTGRIFLQDNGVAQGSIFDTPDGRWYAMLFRDSGPVGRIPYLVPTKWVNGWPVPDGGKDPAALDLPNEVEPGFGLVASDDFESGELPLEWQWNHNPDDGNWRLRDGKLRITTGRVDDRLYFAKNTLTQRTFGPKCSGRTLVDGTGMKDGDIAGIVALQDSMGYVGLAKNGDSYEVVYYKERSDGKHLIKSERINGSKVFLRVDFDLPMDRGSAKFYYSTDEKSWTAFTDNLNLYYTLGMFVGYRIGLFNMATKTAGGYAEFDWYKIGADVDDEIHLDYAEPVPQTAHNATASPWIIPGLIEAENFDDPGKGEGGASYSDVDAENHGNSDYRKDTPVDLYAKSGNRIVVGYIQKGEWLEYTVNVAKAGDYTLFVAVASDGGSSFKVSLDGDDLTDDVAVPAANKSAGDDEQNFDDYGKVKANVTLPAGIHVLRFTATADWFDMDYFNFVEGKDGKDSAPIGDLEGVGGRADVRFGAAVPGRYNVFAATGKFLATIDVVKNSLLETLKNAGFAKGVYMVREVNGGKIIKIQIK